MEKVEEILIGEVTERWLPMNSNAALRTKAWT